MAKNQPFIYDLLSELRSDPRRQEAVVQSLRRIDSISRDIDDGKASRQDLTNAEAALIPECGFNFGLLIPKVFPRYPLDSPLDLSSRPFMFAMTSMAPNSVITLKAGRQVGKCADGGTKVVTPTGISTLQKLFDEGVPT